MGDQASDATGLEGRTEDMSLRDTWKVENGRIRQSRMSCVLSEMTSMSGEIPERIPFDV